MEVKLSETESIAEQMRGDISKRKRAAEISEIALADTEVGKEMSIKVCRAGRQGKRKSSNHAR